MKVSYFPAFSENIVPHWHYKSPLKSDKGKIMLYNIYVIWLFSFSHAAKAFKCTNMSKAISTFGNSQAPWWSYGSWSHALALDLVL